MEQDKGGSIHIFWKAIFECIDFNVHMLTNETRIYRTLYVQFGWLLIEILK